jgi:purine-nucleoside phosphorylase
MNFLGRKEFEQAANTVRQHTRHQPRVGLVLGSGLDSLADAVEEADIIPYRQIPHWPVPTVEGHIGQLHIGHLEGQSVMVMQGRVHYYEGYPMDQVTLPMRVMQLLGVQSVILTNAAGGLNPNFSPGDLMLITDHINLIGMAGLSPLHGPNDETLGPRFPSMTQVYDPQLRQFAQQAAAEAGIVLHQGIYVCLAGPAFETPADIRFLRLIGADAVGMSTVPEATVARHGGMRVLGISGISNIAITQPDSQQEPSHQEVLEAGKLIAPRLMSVLRGVLRAISRTSGA